MPICANLAICYINYSQSNRQIGREHARKYLHGPSELFLGKDTIELLLIIIEIIRVVEDAGLFEKLLLCCLLTSLDVFDKLGNSGNEEFGAIHHIEVGELINFCEQLMGTLKGDERGIAFLAHSM